MKDEVFLENLPRPANQILNVLWNRNREMGVDELTDALNQDYVVRLGRREVQRFVRLLLHAEYIEARRYGFHIYYRTLGWEYAADVTR